MSRYSLSLPDELKQNAERLASTQGVSLNQFILWAVAEKVGGLERALDDPEFPGVTYKRGASGLPIAVLRGSGVRVRTLWAARTAWGWTDAEIGREYGLRVQQVREALAFALAHSAEVSASVADEEALQQASA